MFSGCHSVCDHLIKHKFVKWYAGCLLHNINWNSNSILTRFCHRASWLGKNAQMFLYIKITSSSDLLRALRKLLYHHLLWRYACKHRGPAPRWKRLFITTNKGVNGAHSSFLPHSSLIRPWLKQLPHYLLSSGSHELWFALLCPCSPLSYPCSALSLSHLSQLVAGEKKQELWFMSSSSCL